VKPLTLGPFLLLFSHLTLEEESEKCFHLFIYFTMRPEVRQSWHENCSDHRSAPPVSDSALLSVDSGFIHNVWYNVHHLDKRKGKKKVTPLKSYSW